MAIGTDDGIWKFGTQDVVSSGNPASTVNDAYSIADEGASVNWANDDDATEGSAVLELNFGTAPTVGSVFLLARLMDVNSDGDDMPVPDADYPEVLVGVFKLDYNNAAEYQTSIPNFQMPMVTAAQKINWYIKNAGTNQTIDVDWKLWIMPKVIGPHA